MFDWLRRRVSRNVRTGTRRGVSEPPPTRWYGLPRRPPIWLSVWLLVGAVTLLLLLWLVFETAFFVGVLAALVMLLVAGGVARILTSRSLEDPHYDDATYAGRRR
jgi:hypothetical protein